MFEIKNKKIDKKIYLKDMPTMRQSLFVASMFILLGLLLAHFAHPYFIGLTILAGLGLLFSSIAGFCPLLVVIQAMPWNK